MVVAHRTKRSSLPKYVEGSSTPLRLCHQCGFLSTDRFHPSSLKSAIYDCRQCVKRQRAEYAKTARGLDAHCSAEVRKRHQVEFTPEDMARVIAAWGNTCFITGAMARKDAKAVGPRSLTLIRADPTAPLSVENCALCLRSKARGLNWHLPPHMLSQWKARAQALGVAEAPPSTAAADDPPAAVLGP